MTEIEQIRKLVESSVTVFVAQDKRETGIVLTKQKILSLITTIEQNEVVYKDCENLCKLLQKENAEFETTIESLQAGKEIALNSHRFLEKVISQHEATIESQKEEIERLRFGITTAIETWEKIDLEDDPVNVMDKVIETFYVAKGYFLSQEGEK